MMKKALTFVSVFAIVMSLASVASAQFGGTATFVTNITGIGGVMGVIQKVSTWFLTIVIAISVLFFVYAGFLYVTSGGDEDQVKKAKNYLLYGVIGIAVALLAAAITNVVQGLVGETSGNP